MPDYNDVIAEFRDAFARAGLVAPGEIIADGEWHHCDLASKRPGNNDGSYWIATDGYPSGQLHSFVDGRTVTWHPNRTERKFTKAERDAAKRKIEEAKAQREAIRAAQAEKVADTAETILTTWPDLIESEYLTRKRVGIYGGLKKHPLATNMFYVPMRDIDGKLCAWQTILDDGTKDYPWGVRKAGLFHAIGELVDGKPVQIGEGYATCASAYESNGVTSIVAFDAGNLIHVAKAIHERYPNSPITLLADDDAGTARERGFNPGIRDATAAAIAVGGKIAVPQFGPGRDDKKQSDFNDVHASDGLGAVREQIAAAKEPQPEPPTYPEPKDPLRLDQGRTRIAELVDELVRDTLKPKKSTDFNLPTVIAIDAPAGIGKTRAYLRRIPELLNAGKKVIIAVPTHMLGEQLVRDLEKSLSARVWRSRTAADPNAIGKSMCWQVDLIKSVLGALGDEERHACKSGDDICPLYEQCGFQKQKKDPPRLWIVAHQYLYRKLPSAIRKGGDPDVVIIDEAFHDAGNDKDLKIHLAWLIDQKKRLDRIAFKESLNAQKGQRLYEISRQTYKALIPTTERRRIDKQMLAGYLTLEAAKEAVEYEWMRKRRLEIEYPEEKLGRVRPGHDDAKDNADERIDHNREVDALARFWEYSADLLASGRDVSLNLYFDPQLEIDDVRAPGIRIKRRSKLHEWVTRCPLLHLDATMSKVIVKQLLPQAQFREVSVKFPPTEVVFIKQVIDRINGKSSFTERRIGEIRDEVKQTAGFYHETKVAVICTDGLEKELRKTKPKNVALAHYGHLRGRNDLETVGVEVVVGRDEPSPEEAEAKTRLLFECEVEELPDPPPGKTRYYPLVTRHLRLRDGTTVAVENHEHPDFRVEAYRRASVEAELMQAVFRVRPLNRPPWRPVIIILMTSVCLPLPVDRAVTWKEMHQSLFQRMMTAKGGATDSPAHAYKLFAEWWPNVEAAKKALQREPYRNPRLIKKFLSFAPAKWPVGHSRPHTRMRGQNPVLSPITGFCPFIPGNLTPASRSRDRAELYASIMFDGDPPAIVPLQIVLAALFEEEWPGVKSIQYREAGSRANRPATFYYDPLSIQDPLTWLSAELGCAVINVPIES